MLAWGPFFWSVAKLDNAKDIYSSIFTYFILIGIFVALSISVLSKEVLSIMATPPFYSAYKIVPLIAFSYILLGCFSILAVGIGIKKKTKWIPLITGIGAIANLGLNYLLIPLYGMVGAAIATLLSYSLLPIGSYLVSRRYYVVSYEWSRVIKILVVASLIYVGCYFSPTVFIKVPILLTYPILLYLFKFYHPDELTKAWAILSRKKVI